MRVLDFSPEGATKDMCTCFLPFDSISSSAILLIHQCCLLYTINNMPTNQDNLLFSYCQT